MIHLESQRMAKWIEKTWVFQQRRMNISSVFFVIDKHETEVMNSRMISYFLKVSFLCLWLNFLMLLILTLLREGDGED